MKREVLVKVYSLYKLMWSYSVRHLISNLPSVFLAYIIKWTIEFAVLE